MDWDICSVRGNRMRNEDYALFREGVGACVADGIGGAPLGDTMARCACHVALSSLEAGATVVGAMLDACDYAARMIRDLSLQGSGAALTLLKLNRDKLEIAWLGDVAICVVGSGLVELTNFGELDLNGEAITRGVGLANAKPHFAEAELAHDVRIAICTDGAWRAVGLTGVVDALTTASSPQVAAANLAMNRRVQDNATALVLFAER